MTRQIVQVSRDVTELLIQFKDPEPEHIRGELGIDVSRWQLSIDWDAVAAHQPRVGFAGIRATMGVRGLAQDGTVLGLDPFFERNWAEAKRVGIQRSAYHYFANNGVDPRKQFENFFSAINHDMGELPFTLDVEPAGSQVITDKVGNANNVLTWLAECERLTGVRPMIYTNKSAWDACTGGASWGSSYKLWVAQYNNRPTPTISPPWTRCQIWQYTASGRMSGITPNCDLNKYGPYP